MTFVTRVFFVLVSVGAGMQARAQSNMLINGDFETVIGPGCNSNVPNASLGGVLPSLTGFGLENSVDVFSNPPCVGLPAFSGTTKVVLESDLTGTADAFSFGLSSPIVSGMSYTVSFAGYADPTLAGTLGSIQVGISNDRTMFGVQVAGFLMQSFTNWTTFSATFSAPTHAHYLTVRSAGLFCWSHVDDFSLTPNATSWYCAGDGAGTGCPCGNNSAMGAGEGCTSSLGTGGRLRSVGASSLSSDMLVLEGDQMPNASALYFQGTQQTAGGAGILFGDGLRCASGTVVRIGLEMNVSNASRYPWPGNPSVSVRGQVTAPGVRDYQVWFRNTAAFCTSSTFNLTNAIEVTWGP